MLKIIGSIKTRENNQPIFSLWKYRIGNAHIREQAKEHNITLMLVPSIKAEKRLLSQLLLNIQSEFANKIMYEQANPPKEKISMILSIFFWISDIVI